MWVPYAFAVYGREEERAVQSVIRHKETMLGEKTAGFENRVAALFGKRYGVAVNSGSSANLIALTLLNLSRGTRVITPVLTFSTTVAPILQLGMRPEYVDVEEGSYLANLDEVQDRAGAGSAGAMMIPNILGNLPDLARLEDISGDAGLRFVQDSCDTLGGSFDNRPAGVYSDIVTTSFYGSHVITAAGGGGMLCLNDPLLLRRAKILRGWGRASAVDENRSLRARLSARIGDMEYDSKFLFEEIGYNFLPLEIQSAFGLEQLKKLDRFAKIRERNFKILYKFFGRYRDMFVLPAQHENARTTWLAFPITIREGQKFSRRELTMYLERRNIQTRPIFTGNILMQPGFERTEKRSLAKRFPVADRIMRNGLVVGINQGLSLKHMEKLMAVIEKFIEEH